MTPSMIYLSVRNIKKPPIKADAIGNPNSFIRVNISIRLYLYEKGFRKDFFSN